MHNISGETNLPKIRSNKHMCTKKEKDKKKDQTKTKKLIWYDMRKLTYRSYLLQLSCTTRPSRSFLNRTFSWRHRWWWCWSHVPLSLFVLPRPLLPLLPLKVVVVVVGIEHRVVLHLHERHFLWGYPKKVGWFCVYTRTRWRWRNLNRCSYFLPVFIFCSHSLNPN